jgi:capsular polysaccharide biosynthesis protein
MNKNSEDFTWLWQKRFMKRASLGAFACAVLVFIVTSSWFIKPLYESEVIVYVPLAILSQQLNQQGIGFASDREIDWYIQILKSNQLTDSLIKRYDLLTYFKIDASDLDSKNQLYRKMEKRIIIDKTQYGSVSIRVRDNDPKRAADMANEIIVLGEVIKRNLLFPNRMESMRYVTSLYNQKASDVARIQKTLDSLMNTPPGVKRDFLYSKTQTQYNLEFQELIARKGIYEREQKNFATPLPSAYIISSAVPKSQVIWPRQYLLTGAGAAIYLLVIVVFEIIRRDNKEVV